MSNGRKAKGGPSLLKRLAGGNGNGDKTKAQERRMPRGSSTPTRISGTRTEPSMRAVQRKYGMEPQEKHGREFHSREYTQSEPPERGRRRQYRSYTAAEKVGREVVPKTSSKTHREKVEEHKKKHRPGLKEGEYWTL